MQNPIVPYGKIIVILFLLLATTVFGSPQGDTTGLREQKDPEASAEVVADPSIQENGADPSIKSTGAVAPYRANTDIQCYWEFVCKTGERTTVAWLVEVSKQAATTAFERLWPETRQWLPTKFSDNPTQSRFTRCLCSSTFFDLELWSRVSS